MPAKVCGVDLAAKAKNITGVAFIEGRRITARSLQSDEEILETIRREKPEIVAMDAPLTTRTDRYAERYLARYGALSLKIPAMIALARRALALRDELRDYEVIEVFPTATAKILGFYDRNKKRMLKHFSSFEILGGKNEHEVDAIIAAYTALLYIEGKTEEVDGVVIPRSPSELGAH